MKRLEDMPNIGSNTAQKLRSVGIDTPEKLVEAGSTVAANKLLISGEDVCQNMFFGLEGAIQGLRWHNFPDETKAKLKAEYNNLEAR